VGNSIGIKNVQQSGGSRVLLPLQYRCAQPIKVSRHFCK